MPMIERQQSESVHIRRRWIAALAAILAASALFAWWTVERVNRQMSAGALEKARLVTSAVNLERIRALTGTEADLSSPDYLRIKEQFGAMKQADSKCRFIYLMGRKADGQVFFYVDSEPVGAEDEASAGQIYEEVPAEYLRSFDTKTALTVGPVTDRWGTWVTSLIPIRDSQTDELLAVLGMDVAAVTWKQDILAAVALPVGTMLIVFLAAVLVLFLVRQRRTNARIIVQQAALEESETLQRMLLDSLPVGVVIVDPATRTIERVNDHVVALFGGPVDHLLNHRCHSLLCPASEGACPVCDLGKTVDDSEREMLRVDGSRLSILKTVKRVQWNHQEKLLECFVDISERKVAQERLQQAEESQRILLDNIQTQVWYLTDDHTYGAVNEAHAAFNGVQKKALAYKDMYDIFPEDIVEVCRQGNVEVFTTGKPVRTEEWVPHVSGERRLISVLKSPRLRADGTVEYVVCSAEDITERKRVEESLRESEEKHRLLIENALSGIAVHEVVLDAAGKPVDYVFLDANAAFETHTGLKPADVLGRRITEVLPGMEKTPFIEIYGKVVLTGEPTTFEQFSEPLGRHFAVNAYKLGEGRFATVFNDITMRRQAERDLQAVRDRLELAMDAGEHGFWDWNLETDEIYFSPRYYTMLGYAPGELPMVKETWVGLMHPDDRETVVHRVEKHVQSAEPYHIDFRLKCKDGSWKWISGQGKGYLGDESGKPRRAVGTHVDVTERKEAEEALRLSREQFMLAVRGTNDGIWDWHLRDNSLFLSPKWKEQLGYDDDELENVFASFEERIHPEDKPSVLDYVNRYLKGELEYYHIEFRMRHKDGTYRWMLARGEAIRDECGLPYRMAGSHTDITERKQAEEQILLNQARLQSLHDINQHPAENISDLLDYTLDHAMRLTGSQVAHIYHYDEASEQFVLNSWSRDVMEQCSIVEPQTVCDLAKTGVWGEAVRQRQPIVVNDFQAPNALKHGYPQGHVELTRFATAPVFDRGKIVMVVGVANKESDYTQSDIQQLNLLMEAVLRITLRRKAEQNLKDTVAVLEHTNQELESAIIRANELAVQAEMASIAKSEFLANMSHEIRTPMNGVIGMTGLLLDTELTEEQRRYADIVRASGESLLGLINDILDFSKIEAGKLDLEMLDFDLLSLLEDFAATVAVRAHERGLEFLCAADLAVPTLLRGDPGRLRQILTNMVGNAIKFTPAGEVAVRVAVESEDEETVLLHFCVRDTGIGIPTDKVGSIFDKFSQVDASTTRRYGGTGLGLAISRQLAGLMGGEVGVESKEGRGSEFWFTARFSKQAQRAKPELSAPADLRGVRVLIVDDNATAREILMTLTTAWGMRPAEALGGAEALPSLARAMAEGDPFRLAVIDMQMPVMDGEALGKAIRADERLADTRMVMLTSLGARGDARRYAEIGFAGYFTKPVRQQELRDVLSLALAERDDGRTTHPITTRHTAREMLDRFVGRKARILLVEDNVINQRVGLGILKKLGLRADAVADGMEAIKTLETIPYDLVLMDVQMPVMDGLEAALQIRSPQSSVLNRHIPIIAMTAHAMQGDRERCLAAGMDDYVSKPVLPQSLAETLEKWLPKPGS